MNKKQTKNQISQLKNQLSAANRTSNIRLLKMTLVLVILAIIAAVMYGRIQLW